MSWLTSAVPKKVRDALLNAWRAAVAALLAALFQNVGAVQAENVQLRADLVKLSASCLNNPAPAQASQA